MTYNLDRCIGCWACAVACKSENSVGEGLWWQQVDTIGG
ncbi:MAG: 4Fe-4S ferredoxin, partial [Gammaproteobacteria bacterium]|nr:4Fe-4S ferredoxin [Gammaproteobacteria bacterium]NIT64582.1 4Fe-4S ferredoxin [Gammaproteobacteria bacterium]NIV21541.1 4Fe-4S ferredoxin [Gammaproteobacteria bacterium]NIY33162.1 4Fe-4S ferredoxin [Gammaproteobacteria bacterium]